MKRVFVPFPNRGGPCLHRCDDSCKSPDQCERWRFVAAKACPICRGPIGYGLEYREAKPNEFMKETLSERLYVHTACATYEAQKQREVAEATETRLDDQRARYFFLRTAVQVSQLTGISVSKLVGRYPKQCPERLFVVWLLRETSGAKFDEIAKAYKRDRTWVSTSCKKVEAVLQNDQAPNHRLFWGILNEILCYPWIGSAAFESEKPAEVAAPEPAPVIEKSSRKTPRKPAPERFVSNRATNEIRGGGVMTL